VPCSQDETILPTDFNSAGVIVDDDLNAMMVRPLAPGVTLHALIDACHSGTAMDLPYRAKVGSDGRFSWKVGWVGGSVERSQRGVHAFVLSRLLCVKTLGCVAVAHVSVGTVSMYCVPQRCCVAAVRSCCNSYCVTALS
jgi:hypothetical protein